MSARLRPDNPFGFLSSEEPGAPAPETPSLEHLLRRFLPVAPSGSGASTKSAELPMSEVVERLYGPAGPVAPKYPPLRGNGYRIPIIPEPERSTLSPFELPSPAEPSWSNLYGMPPPQRRVPAAAPRPDIGGGQNDSLQPSIGLPVPSLTVDLPGTPVGRIADAATRAVAGLFEPPLGISKESLGSLINQGPEDYRGARAYTSLIRSFNDVLIRGGTQVSDAALRLAAVPVVGGFAAMMQVARERGLSETDTRRLERDLHGLALSASVVMGGAPGMGLATGGTRGAGVLANSSIVLPETKLHEAIDTAVQALPADARSRAAKEMRDAYRQGAEAGAKAARERQVAGTDLVPGSRDPQTGALVMQPWTDRHVLLREAENARPGFDASLREIADGIPGTLVDGPRVKADGPRLDQKIGRHHRDLERKGKHSSAPDDGAHLIDDYLAGRLVVDSQEALDKIVEVVESRLEIVQKLDRMKEPIRSTGYTGLYYQVKLPNGMTAELQIQPRPFWEGAKEQRSSYEILRQFEDRKKTDIQERKLAEERGKSRAIFDKAWQDWVASGGKDVRRSNPPRSGAGEQ